jgi:fatty-acyl-CoA synthase
MDARIFDSLEFWSRHSPQETAVTLSGRSLDYRTLARWSDAIAVHIAARGVRPGDAVTIAAGTLIEWIVAGYAIAKCGAIIAPFNPRFVKAEVAQLLQITSPRLVFADAPRAGLIRQINQDGADYPILELESIGSLRQDDVAWTPPATSPDATALLVFTSGTTGAPKGVMFTHRQLLSSYIERRLIDASYGPHMRQLMVLPLYAGPGTMWGWIPTLLFGGRMVIHDKFDPGEALAAIERDGITHLSGPPILYEQMCRHEMFAATNLSSLACAMVGGARVTSALLAAWNARGVRLRQMYGQTEICGYGTTATDREVDSGADTCGAGGMFTRIRTVRPDGTDCDVDEVGQILMRGPSQTAGYWRNPEETARTIIDGWLHTGDLGVLDEHGCLRFVDRLKHIIISGGYNISPNELENVIIDVPGILEVAVFAVPDEKFGETPAACYFASANPVTPEQIVAHCCERLADFKVPRYVIRMPEPLPRMSSGKIAKRDLEKQFADAPSRFPRLR